MDKRSSLFAEEPVTKKTFYNSDTSNKCHKTFFFVTDKKANICYIVRTWQAFPEAVFLVVCDLSMNEL